MAAETNDKTVNAVMELTMLFKHVRDMRVKTVGNQGLTHDATMTLFTIKYLLSKNPAGVKISEISKCLGIAAPGLTPTITRLESLGYVKRNIDLKDRRVIRVTFTAEGLVFLEDQKRKMQSTVRELVEYLGEERTATGIALLKDVQEFFKTHPAL